MDKSQLPLVSVIITTYKRSNMLKRAIDSVLNQTYKNIEIIVVDDNDPNTEFRLMTEKLMSQYEAISKVKYIKHPKNMNGATARNTGISSCSGEIVSFLDDDDWYFPEKVKKQVEFLLEYSEFDAVYCGWERNNKKVMRTKEGNLLFEQLSGTNLIITNAIMMKKKAAIKCGGWDERYQRNQEAAFLIRFFRCGYKIGVIKEILIGFDTSDRTNSSNPIKNEEDFDFFLQSHENEIANCEIIHKNSRKIIYSYRYRAVLLNYIKNRYYLRGFKLYLRMLKSIPIRFNLDLYKYFKKRIMN